MKKTFGEPRYWKQHPAEHGMRFRWAKNLDCTGATWYLSFIDGSGVMRLAYFSVSNERGRDEAARQLRAAHHMVKGLSKIQIEEEAWESIHR